MELMARLEILAHQDYKAQKVLVVIKEQEDQKEMKELWDLPVTLDIVNVIK